MKQFYKLGLTAVNIPRHGNCIKFDPVISFPGMCVLCVCSYVRVCAYVLACVRVCSCVFEILSFQLMYVITHFVCQLTILMVKYFVFNITFDLTDVGSSRKDVENFCTALEEKAVCTYNV